MTLSNENALIANGTSRIALDFAVGGTHRPSPYTQNPDAASPPANDHIAIEVGRLLDEVRHAVNFDLKEAQASAARLAAYLANKFPLDVRSAPARGGLAPWQKRKVQSFIENGLEEPLPIEGMAKLVSLSSSHFCRVFKESFGEPPHAYVVRMRIERARTLMLTTTESLSHIAVACGLVDQAHLCRCFRQITGATPGAWRRSHAADPGVAAIQR